jgi:diguanylate cyclase (GGDEF)-like protein
MKSEFYDKSKRAHIYSSIFIYKVASLIILLIMTVILAVLFHKDKAMYHEKIGEQTPAIFFVMAACLILFVLSILFDFYILKRTTSIGSHLNQLAYIDKLTGLPNRYSCDLLINSYNDPERLRNSGFILLKINNLAAVNADNGHDNGNFLISEFCSILEDVTSEYGYVGRNGGNEFLVLMDDCDSTKADMFLLDLTKRIHGYNEMNVGTPLEVAYSRLINQDEKAEKISDLISKGYQKIREAPQILS